MAKEVNHTNIRFWGGLRTIGGTVVSVEYKDSRVIFDFGLTYNPASNIFDGQIKRRVHGMVRDNLKLNLIPAIDGVYSAENLGTYQHDLIPAEENGQETAVIISHLHLDHIGAMGSIAPSIPVYLTKESYELYHALEVIGEGVPGKRNYQSCDYGVSFSIGEITITPIQVDHDILGACGFHIQTPNGAILYTGDLRLHGKYPERIEHFINEVNRLGIDALIIEGTTLSNVEEMREAIIGNPIVPEGMTTEITIPEKMSNKLNETKGLGIFNVYHRNIDRLIGIIKASQGSSRKAVFEHETAYLLDKLTDEHDFLVYKSVETIFEEQTGTLPDWKSELLKRYESISAEKININPGEYFLQNTYENVLELFDLDVCEGIYIHSNGVPLGSFDPAFENLKKILNKLDVDYDYIGAGGHAIPSHLKYIVDRIDPKFLLPLHSFNPERLKPKSGIQLLADYGVDYTLKDHQILANEGKE
ncbi:putative hydrolase [Neobacillus bataviensis LMG 21833]|uniref:Putative hydrolase n=1 Tax=Neobacillus bataviensis LMG 21833 TaxID=1117379 RepID=K6DER2_9BACI|nr:MBL fold metallo-hydrolase [Neobacillus bataviensis]EKN71007.1 putative hydrolase [Neobacillus bataviensis LMG 21833]